MVFRKAAPLGHPPGKCRGRGLRSVVVLPVGVDRLAAWLRQPWGSPPLTHRIVQEDFLQHVPGEFHASRPACSPPRSELRREVAKSPAASSRRDPISLSSLRTGIIGIGVPLIVSRSTCLHERATIYRRPWSCCCTCSPSR